MNQFVAGFIGSPAMNLQTVPLTEGGVRIAGTTLPLPTAVRTAASQADLKELVLGIRPEHLHLADGTASAGEVLLVEELGADALLHVRLAESANQVVARTEGRVSLTPGNESPSASSQMTSSHSTRRREPALRARPRGGRPGRIPWSRHCD